MSTLNRILLHDEKIIATRKLFIAKANFHHSSVVMNTDNIASETGGKRETPSYMTRALLLR